MADGILGWIQLGLAVVGLVAAILLPISYKFSPVRTVRAKVVDKSKVEFPSKYGTNTKYTARTQNIPWFFKQKAARSCPSMCQNFPTAATAAVSPVC